MSKLKKILKTQGKNSKLKAKTQKVGTFRIPGCRKSVKKPWLKARKILLYTFLIFSSTFNSSVNETSLSNTAAVTNGSSMNGTPPSSISGLGGAGGGQSDLSFNSFTSATTTTTRSGPGCYC